jgi:hypothetical protein
MDIELNNPILAVCSKKYAEIETIIPETKTPTLAIDVDLETWSLRKDADIRSIGATVSWTSHCTTFDASSVKLKKPFFYRACYNPVVSANKDGVARRMFDLHIDPKTSKWWEDLLNGPKGEFYKRSFDNPERLDRVLIEFFAWIDDLKKETEAQEVIIYANGSHFDLPILMNAIHETGVTPSIHYRAPRDTRTMLQDVSNRHGTTPAQLAKLLSFECEHHALFDALVGSLLHHVGKYGLEPERTFRSDLCELVDSSGRAHKGIFDKLYGEGKFEEFLSGLRGGLAG